MPAQRQRAIAFAGSGEEGIGDCRDQRDWTYLSRSAENLRSAINKVQFDGRCLVHLRDHVIVEVGFDGAPVLETDIGLECHAEAPHCSTFNRVPGYVGIERDTTINYAREAMNLYEITIDGKLDRVRDMRAKSFGVGNSASYPSGRLLTPIGFLEQRLEDFQ